MLHVSSVTKRMGTHQVLHGVDLALSAGEVVVILGANGAGKTTLMRILSTFLRADSGQITLQGVDYAKGASRLRPSIGWITHEPLGYLSWSPYQNLQFLGRMYGISELSSRVLNLLDRVGILTFAHEPLRIFSRGMTQRFMIARALIHDPPLLLLDEPFSGLDLRGQEFMTQLVEEERARGKGLLLTTHTTALAHKVGDRYLVLNKGKLVSLGEAGRTSLAELEQSYQEHLRT